MPINLEKKRGVFTDEYKESIFKTWYRLGKPHATALCAHVSPDPATGDMPIPATLQKWINEEFIPHSELLDGEVRRALDARLIQEKIEMLTRHGELGRHMQETAKEYIDEHKDELRPPTAIKMLIEGVRIERDSSGIPEMLRKLADESDDALLERVKELFTSAAPELLDGEELGIETLSDL